MKLRLIVYKQKKYLLCPNGSVLEADSRVLSKMLSSFRTPNKFKGTAGYWNQASPSMENVLGETLAYVDNSSKLIVLNEKAFEDIIVSDRYISAAEYADLHSKSKASVKNMCKDGRITGAFKNSAGWQIPINAPYPPRKERQTKTKQ